MGLILGRSKGTMRGEAGRRERMLSPNLDRLLFVAEDEEEVAVVLGAS